MKKIGVRLGMLFGCAAAFGVRTQAQSIYSTPYYFSTLAGISSVGDSDGTGSTARFFGPRDATVDAGGNLYVVDTLNHTIRKVTPGGLVTTFAGLAGVQGTADGRGSAVRFNHPRGITSDLTGNLYVTDTENFTIRKITPQGDVTTIAGLAGNRGFIDGTGSSARFTHPKNIIVDGTGDLIVSDDNGYSLNEIGQVIFDQQAILGDNIRKITPSGTVSTLRNNASIHGLGGYGEGAEAGALTVDSSGNILVSTTAGLIGDPADGTIAINSALQMLTPDHNLTFLMGFSYSDDRIHNQLTGSILNDIKIDPAGNILAALGSSVSTLVPSTHSTVVLAGGSQPGFTDGLREMGAFLGPLHLAVTRDGNVFVVDQGNNNIRKIAANGQVTTVAGVAALAASGTADGDGQAARFVSPAGLAVDQRGNIYVADELGNTVRKISVTGQVSTLGKTSPGGVTFSLPSGIAVDSHGTVFVANTWDSTIVRIAGDGTVTIFAGASRQNGHTDGKGSEARFSFPTGLAIDANDTLYVTDQYTVRLITPTGEVSTLPAAHYADGTPISNIFLKAIAVDNQGRLYVSSQSCLIYRMQKNGEVSDLVSTVSGDADGTASAASFKEISALAVDAAANLYVSDAYNHTIRKISANGQVTTLAGLLHVAGNADGTGREARFYRPEGIAVDKDGSLYVSSGTTIRKGQLAGAPTISVQPQSQTVVQGNTVQLSVSAGGLPEPTYQWYFNGVLFSGATGSSLSIASVRSSDAGDYWVVVTNSIGNVTSSKATLTVSPSSPPPSSNPDNSGGGSMGQAFTTLIFLAGALRTRFGRKTSG